MKKMQHLRAPGIQLGEAFIEQNNVGERVQVLRTGLFHHPEYGDFEITKTILSDMVKNFDEKVRRVDLAIDYSHESDKTAAAWITSLELSNEGSELWAVVKWTPQGKQKLIDREYRYLSADFTLDYVDTESLQKFGPVLFGAGLTNRPYVKDMAPAIELNEGKGNQEMDPKDKQIAELQAQVEELKKALAAKDSAAGQGEGDSEELSAAKKALEDSKAKCAELEEKVKAGEAEKEKAGKEAKFAELVKAGKAVEAQREPFMSGDAMKFAELAQAVKLNEAGHGETDNGGETASNKDEAEKKILELAQKKVKETKGLVLSDAVKQVRAANPDLVKLCS